MLKQVIYKPVGMQGDLSISSFNPKYAYSINNMRVTNYGNNTLLSLVNEKGTKEISITGDTITGTIIGEATIEDTMVLFVTNDYGGRDSIYKLVKDEDKDVYINKRLFNGILNFSPEHPIECLPLYENKDLQKVYWTDGINPMRMINISDETTKYNNYSFDFIAKLDLKEEVRIFNYNTGGSFKSGSIQYAFTYFNKYGRESNIFYTSQLFYIAYKNRGATNDEIPSNSFNINIANVQTEFDYIRIYSIHRTSIDSTPEVKIVDDIPVNKDNTLGWNINYTDTGTNGEIIDPTVLLYVGGEQIIAQTMTQKDNTLFLGNIKLNRNYINQDIRDILRSVSPEFTYQVQDANNNTIAKWLNVPVTTGTYTYKSYMYLEEYRNKIFKYNEYYRLGIQFQHYTGRWSEAVFLADLQNTLPLKEDSQVNYNTSVESISAAIGTYTIPDKAKQKLLDAGYIKARGVVVYPSIEDRTILMQGVLNPTVYRIRDRMSNSPYAQASWFFRPNPPFDTNEKNNGSNVLKTMLMANDLYIKNNTTQLNVRQNGKYPEFRHNASIGKNSDMNGEISGMQGIDLTKGWTKPDNQEFSDTGIDGYNVDQSIVTLNSPDLEFDEDIQNIDLSSYKLRIVGAIPIDAFDSKLNIETSTPPAVYYNTSTVAPGFYNPPLTVGCNNFMFGWRMRLGNFNWMDALTNWKNNASQTEPVFLGFMVFPWQKQGSLNNSQVDPDNGVRSAKLLYNQRINFRFSTNTRYFQNGYKWEGNGVSDIQIFNSNETSMIRLKGQYDGDPDINYYGNIDSIFTGRGDNSSYYQIMVSQDWGKPSDAASKNKVYNMQSEELQYSGLAEGITGNNMNSTEPVSIKYKSGIHAVIALKRFPTLQQILPTQNDLINNVWTTVNNQNNTWGNTGDNTEKNILPWNTNIKGTYQDTIDISERGANIYYDEPGISIGNTEIGEHFVGMNRGYLWLGELYKRKSDTMFGGNTEQAYTNNNWLPAGQSMDMRETNLVVYTTGDTYYQRYDCLKTYPFTKEDTNQNTEILSFMCETHCNIDGRTDRNRGQCNLSLSPVNFNLFNEVYNQSNNYFVYHNLNLTNINLSNFVNQITWTKTKTLGENVDTWTNITMASVIDLDGDKGQLKALKRFNSNIIAFQDHGIAQVLYNENTQMTTTEGVPVEIANSGKVQGIRYIDDTIGCQVKQSISGSSRGLYFVDNISKGIYLLSNGITSLSDNLGQRNFVQKNIKNILNWSIFSYNNIISYYDNVNKNVMFLTEKTCLSYSEMLNQFEGFYSYGSVTFVDNMNNNTMLIKNNKVYEMNQGEYNYFFGKYEPYGVTYAVNPEITLDKIFNNIEFAADNYSNDKLDSFMTFDTLKVWNEYQSGTSNLNYTKGISNLKKKFRMWYANIPRDDANHRDRIRNTWCYLNISQDKETIDKTELHYLTVKYSTLEPVAQKNNGNNDRNNNNNDDDND